LLLRLGAALLDDRHRSKLVGAGRLGLKTKLAQKISITSKTKSPEEWFRMHMKE
jgi:hypothetical protein